MIIGTGMVSTAFKQFEDDPDVIIFASGVSNSKTTNQAEFDREMDLFFSVVNPIRKGEREYTGKQKFIYFSTCSINDPSVNQSKYISHKKIMEGLVQSVMYKNYLIIRTTNLVGRSECPSLLMNFLVYCIQYGYEFDLWTKSVRNLLDVDNFRDFVVQNMMDKKNQTLSVFNTINYPVPFIVQVIEKHLKKVAVYTKKDKGSDYKLTGAGLKFNDTTPEQYLMFLLKKYYPNHD